MQLPDEITITWSYEDVQEQDSTLTDDEARQILQLIKRKHDANIGENWENAVLSIDQGGNGYSARLRL